MSLMSEVGQKAFNLGVPLAVHMDVTYRCNERCVHCYLDHDDHGEMTTAEIKDVLDQLAEAGVFFITFSGGEVLMRRDFFEIVEYARRLMFNVKIKTNAVMIHEEEARRIRELGVDTIQISVYSHRPEVHDAITKLPHSFERTVKAIRFLREQGLRVTIANVLMTVNSSDHSGVQELAAELGVQYTLDPTITPMMDGDMSVLSLRIPGEELNEIFRNPALVANQEEFCAPPKPPSAGGSGGLFVQRGPFLLLHFALWRCLSLRAVSTSHGKYPSSRKFLDIWNFSPADEGGSLDPGQRLDRLLVMLARRQLHALSGPGLYGRKYARPVHRGLREVILPDGHTDGEHAETGIVEAADDVGNTPLIQIRPVAVPA